MKKNIYRENNTECPQKCWNLVIILKVSNVYLRYDMDILGHSS